MHSFRGSELSASEQYKLLTGSILPRPIAWLAPLNQETEQLNLAPFSFFNVVAKEEPLLSLSILREGGAQKDSAFHLAQQKEGVIHLVSREHVKAMNQTAARLPRAESELTLTELTTVPSTVVKTAGLAEALVRFEVQVRTHLPVTSQAGEVISDLFILEVVAFHFAEATLDPARFYVDVPALDPVARLAGNEYTTLGEIFTEIRA